MAAAGLPIALTPEEAEAAGKGTGRPTEPSGPAGRPIVPITTMHQALAAFAGTWNISQKLYPGPGSEPVLNHGRTTCRVLLNGLAVFMESELDNGYKAIVLTTWNANTGRYEGVFMDLHSFDGFDPLVGMPAGNFQDMTNPAPLTGSPEPKRVWNGRLTVPRMTAVAEGAPLQLAGVDELSAQIVENQLSEVEWCAECIALAANSEPFVMLENTYTRVGSAGA